MYEVKLVDSKQSFLCSAIFHEHIVTQECLLFLSFFFFFENFQAEFLETELGVVFDLDQLEAALRKCRPAVVFVTHAESSTGMKQPLEGVGELVRR